MVKGQLNKYLSRPVDHTQAGEGEKDDPPEPENQEEVLVEQVVGENAQRVGSFRKTNNAT